MARTNADEPEVVEAQVEEIVVEESVTPEEGVFDSPEFVEPDPNYRDPNLVYLIYKGNANAFAAEDDTLLKRGVPTGVQPKLAEKLLFHYRKTQEIVKE